MPIRSVVVVMLLCVTCPLARAVPPAGDDTIGVNGTRLAIVCGTAAAGITAIHLYQQNAW